MKTSFITSDRGHHRVNPSRSRSAPFQEQPLILPFSRSDNINRQTSEIYLVASVYFFLFNLFLSDTKPVVGSIWLLRSPLLNKPAKTTKHISPSTKPQQNKAARKKPVALKQSKAEHRKTCSVANIYIYWLILVGYNLV